MINEILSVFCPNLSLNKSSSDSSLSSHTNLLYNPRPERTTLAPRPSSLFRFRFYKSTTTLPSGDCATVRKRHTSCFSRKTSIIDDDKKDIESIKESEKHPIVIPDISTLTITNTNTNITSINTTLPSTSAITTVAVTNPSTTIVSSSISTPITTMAINLSDPFAGLDPVADAAEIKKREEQIALAYLRTTVKQVAAGNTPRVPAHMDLAAEMPSSLIPQYGGKVSLWAERIENI